MPAGQQYLGLAVINGESQLILLHQVRVSPEIQCPDTRSSHQGAERDFPRSASTGLATVDLLSEINHPLTILDVGFHEGDLTHHALEAGQQGVIFTFVKQQIRVMSTWSSKDSGIVGVGVGVGVGVDGHEAGG